METITVLVMKNSSIVIAIFNKKNNNAKIKYSPKFCFYMIPILQTDIKVHVLWFVCGFL